MESKTLNVKSKRQEKVKPCLEKQEQVHINDIRHDLDQDDLRPLLGEVEDE